MEQLRALGQAVLRFFTAWGQAGIFLMSTLWRRPRLIKSFPLLIEELYAVGVLSLSIVVVAAVFIGMVVALQGYNTLKDFGATAQLGRVIALSVVRELGPVVTALLFAGRAGSALTAEIGLMKSTEQLASMEMMGVDPLWRVISPRFWAVWIALPILVTIFNAMAILGGYFVGVVWLGLDQGIFWNNMQSSVAFYDDIMNGLIKAGVFGFVAAWIAVYQGYNAVPTAEGISWATTRSVVYTSLAVLGLDFFLTAVMMKGW